MTGDRIVDRTHESIINDALARVLRERVGLDAAARGLKSPCLSGCSGQAEAS